MNLVPRGAVWRCCLGVLFGEVMEPLDGVLLEDMLLSATGFKAL